MGVNQEARSRANQHIDDLPDFTVDQLRELCQTLNTPTKQRGKGGTWRWYDKTELQKRIRNVIGQGTFADRLNRFSDMANEFLNDSKPVIDTCGNCKENWPCNCDNPAWICGICGSDNFDCKC